jgi:hypothetical protein
MATALSSRATSAFRIALAWVRPHLERAGPPVLDPHEDHRRRRAPQDEQPDRDAHQPRAQQVEELSLEKPADQEAAEEGPEGQGRQPTRQAGRRPE